MAVASKEVAMATAARQHSLRLLRIVTLKWVEVERAHDVRMAGPVLELTAARHAKERGVRVLSDGGGEGGAGAYRGRYTA